MDDSKEPIEGVDYPCEDWAKTVDFITYFFSDKKDGLYSLYKVHFLNDGTCTWLDHSDNKLDGSYDEMVDWVYEDIRKHFPHVTRELVASYAYINKFIFTCYENDYQQFCKDENIDQQYEEYCRKYGRPEKT